MPINIHTLVSIVSNDLLCDKLKATTWANVKLNQLNDHH